MIVSVRLFQSDLRSCWDWRREEQPFGGPLGEDRDDDLEVVLDHPGQVLELRWQFEANEATISAFEWTFETLLGQGEERSSDPFRSTARKLNRALPLGQASDAMFSVPERCPIGTGNS